MTNKYEERIARAVNLFLEGYNCSQSVVAAFSDLYGFTDEQAFRMSASFGGGIGRMRQTCGAACGLFLLAGLETGTVDGSDQEGKSRNYAIVQRLAERFKTANGSLICAELLKMKAEEKKNNPQAESRTSAYYATRPCLRMVENAARIFAEYLTEQHENSTIG